MGDEVKEKISDMDKRTGIIEERLTMVTTAIIKQSKLTTRTNGKLDTMIAEIKGLTDVMAERMTTMASQYETRLEVHADKIVKMETALEHAEKQLATLNRQVAENDAYDKERSRMIEEAQRQQEAQSARMEKLEEFMNKQNEKTM